MSTIKINDLINWLFREGDPADLPPEFFSQKAKISTLVVYIIEQFWCKPSLINYLNKHINDLYNQPDPLELLKFFKKIIQFRRITKLDIWVYIPKREPDYISEIQNRNKYDEGNTLSKVLMLKYV